MAKTVKGTAGKDVLSSTVSSAKIQALGGNDTVNNYGNTVTVDGGAGDDLIFNYGTKVSINGGAGSDNLGIGVNSSNVTITGGAGDDYITSTTDKGVLFKYNSGDGIDFINGFNTKDTLQISGSSYSTSASGNDFIVSVGKGYVVLKNSAGIPVKIKNSSGKVTTYNKNPSYLLYGTNYADVITNTTKNATVSGAGGNDTIWSYVDDAVIFGDAGNDVIFLGEGHGKNAINYSVGDGYDTVYGFNSRDVLWAYDTAWNTSTVGNDYVLTFQNGAVTLKDTATIHPRLALNVTDNVTTGTILADTEIIDASTRKKAIKITCNELANEMYGGAGKDSLYGGAGNDIIYGNAGNDKLYGQEGDDYLNGGTGNDTLTGGAGNDLFVYIAGKDVITDYASGDKISLGAAVSKATLKGSDAVLTVGKGTLTVKDAKTLTLIDSKGKEFTTVFGSANIDYNDTASTKVTLASGIEIGDASARTTAIRITGNALDNSILGGAGKDTLYGKDGNDYLAGGKGNDKLYGDAGDDTLWGGVGNDTLTGGAGADTFIYASGEGKDVIADFANNDLLQITGTFSATCNKSKNTIAFKVGSTANALTLKDFTATTFNINGTLYRISGSKLVK